MTTTFPIYAGGKFISNAQPLEVVFPYTNEVFATTYLASADNLEAAITAARTAQLPLQQLPIYIRASALAQIAHGIGERKAEFAHILAMETGKPLFYARAEVDRAIQTFTDGAEEAKRIYGEWMALDRHPAGINHQALVRRFPVGLVAAIAPFNFPLNLVAHKLAPAIAAGCPIILKPASKTPLSALLLAELINATELPKGAVSILPMDRETGDALVTDPRFKLLTFTGSPSIGWDMKARAGKKKVVLELGGNAGLIISESANLEKVLSKVVGAAFGQSGQSCVHTQRILVHSSLFSNFCERFVAETKKLTYGNPLETGVMFSSLIDESNAKRIAAWVDEAVTAGATLLTGGARIGTTGYEPTILTKTKPNMKVCANEAFAPIVTVGSFTSFDDALATINNSSFGLQCGIFTNDLSETMRAFEQLEVGGVIINNVSNFRADHMPYGGVKDSGLGREGVRYAIEDMTELKTLVINQDF